MFIGIDIGTRNLKLGLFDEDLRQVELVRTPTPWTDLDGSRALDPAALLRTVMERLVRLAEDAAVTVGGVGIASMAEVGFIETSGGGLPRPATAWFDDRGAESAELLLEEFGDRFAVMTGRSPSPVCTVTKLHVMGSTGDLPRNGRFHSVAEWVAHRLGGDPVAEASLASRTGLLDIRRGVACEEVLAWCGLERGFLPEVRSATEGVGVIRGVHPRIDGAALAVAGHDHLAAMVGVGATAVPEVLDSCGTAEAIVMNAGEDLLAHALDLTRAGGTVSRHVLDGRSAAFAPSFRSGAMLQRVLDELGVEVGDEGALSDLDDRALPLVGGDGAPELPGLLLEPIEWPDDLAGAEAARRWAAAIDSVAATGVRRLGVLHEVLGPPGRVHVTGGWSQGAAVRRAKRALSDDVVFSRTSEAGARGAAAIAAVVADRRPTIPGTEHPSPAPKGRNP